MVRPLFTNAMTNEEWANYEKQRKISDAEYWARNVSREKKLSEYSDDVLTNLFGHGLPGRTDTRATDVDWHDPWRRGDIGAFYTDDQVTIDPQNPDTAQVIDMMVANTGMTRSQALAALLPPQPASNEIPPSRPSSTRRFSNLPPLGPGDPGLYERSGIEAPLPTYGEVVDRPGGHRDVFDFSEQQLGPAPTQRLEPEVSGEQRYTPDQEGPGYWTNPDTGQVVDIESEMGPQYHSTIPMGYAPYDPNRQTGFFSNLGRRLMSGVTAPYRHFTDISDVPVTGSGIGAAASTFGPLLASAAIPGGGLFSLLSRMIPDSGPTPYQQEGQNVTDISFGPKTAWLGADVPGGGYYIPNQKVDMAQLGGGRRAGGRDITVHTPEGLVDATYRVDPTGAASITSDDFGAPNVDYGDIYYGGADYEGLDISDDGSGDQWDAYWGDW